MEFDKSKVYTALNATEDLIGAKGYFDDDLARLRNQVVNEFTRDLKEFKGIERDYYILSVNSTHIYNFFYLVEPASEKWYVFEISNRYELHNKRYLEVSENFIFEGTKEECEQWIEEHSKPKYRPFRNCDELIKRYLDDCYKKRMSPNPNNFINEWIELPTIWVKDKIISDRKRLLQFDGYEVVMATTKMVEHISMGELFNKWEFLDGSPCGVEE